MGWGVNDYPTPRGREEIDERRQCEAKNCSNSIDEGEEIACEHTGCVRDALCAGCSFQCADCELWFCREHIVERPAPYPFVSYRCEDCDAQRQKEAA